MKNRIPCLMLICSMSVAVVAPAVGETPESGGRNNTKVPPRERRKATIHWDNVPLGDAVTRLSDVFSIAIFVDRSIDPTQPIHLDITDVDVDQALAELASTTSLGASKLGPLNYLGPRAATKQLRTLAALRTDELAQLPAADRTALERKRAASWPRLTEPRQLMTDLVQQRSWQVQNADRIPHDLWPAGQLPEMSLAEQLTALLIGFDLTFRLQPRDHTIELIPIDGPVTLRREYRLRYPSADAVLLQQKLPTIQAHIDGNTATVDARLEDHEYLAQLLSDQATRQRAPRAAPETKQVYSLRVQDQPVGSILRQLEQRLGWTINIDEDALRNSGLSLDARVSFAVENATQDELLGAVLRPASMDYEREGQQLRIVPRDANAR